MRGVGQSKRLTVFRKGKTLKVSREHLAAIRAAIEPLDTLERRNAYRSGQYPRADLTKDVNKRYRWDLFYAAGSWRLHDGNYLDSHIDTALRFIVPTL